MGISLWVRVLALLFGLSATARAELLKFSELAKDKQTIFSAAERASVLLEFGHYSCSGAFVSNEGHVLTALHCVLECFDESEVYALGHSGSALYTRLTPKTPMPRHCGLMKIEKISDRFINHDVEAAGGAINAGLAAFNEDFAIFKVELPRPTSCVVVADRYFREGEKMMAIGYPAHREVNGKLEQLYLKTREPFVSETTYYFDGPVKKMVGLLEYSILRLGEWVGLPKIPEENQYVLYKTAGLLTHNILHMTAASGMSGGSVFSEQGEVMATVSALRPNFFNLTSLISKNLSLPRAERMSIREVMREFSAWPANYTIVVPGTNIRKSVRASLGAEAANKMFACDTHVE